MSAGSSRVPGNKCGPATQGTFRAVAPRKRSPTVMQREPYNLHHRNQPTGQRPGRFIVAAVIVGGFVLAPGSIATTVRDIWHGLTA
jgi:hypothetical protein